MYDGPLHLGGAGLEYEPPFSSRRSTSRRSSCRRRVRRRAGPSGGCGATARQRQRPTATTREPTSVAWGWSSRLMGTAELAEEGGVRPTAAATGPWRERGPVLVTVVGAFEQLGDERLQADVELRQLGGREALALRHPRVEERARHPRRAGCRSSPARRPRARQGCSWSARRRAHAGGAGARRTPPARTASLPRSAHAAGGLRPAAIWRRACAARARSFDAVSGAARRERLVDPETRPGFESQETMRRRFEQLLRPRAALAGVDPVAVLGRRLRQRLLPRRARPLRDVASPRLYSKRGGVASPPSGSGGAVSGFCFDACK